MPSRTASTPPPSWDYRRRVIVQLLKDWHVPYSGEEAGWPLNKEVTDRWKNNDVANSHRLLGSALESMVRRSPHYSAIAKVFLQDDASYSSYDFLKHQAERFGVQSDSGKLLPRVEAGIDWLTYWLGGIELYCTFPELEVKTNRRESAEEKYLRIAAVFDAHCDVLKGQFIRYRNKAYAATVETTGEPRTTVERAIHYRDNDENHGQKHRFEKARKSRRCNAKKENKT